MANKRDKSKPLGKQSMVDISEAIFQSKLSRVNWLQRLILKKLKK